MKKVYLSLYVLSWNKEVSQSRFHRI